jgi:ABC-type transport system involved in cytochrome c biogenesis permease component
MKKVKVIFIKELENFIGSERGVFLIYAILVLSWSFLPLNKGIGAGPIWWLFFSVIISGNFSNSVFVAERLNGSMEILLTSGFPRDSVFFGKIAFVLIMSIGIGIICFSLSMAWIEISRLEKMSTWSELLYDAFLFCAGALMNVTFGAWMSFRLQSPRIIPFLTIMVMGLMVAGYYCVSYLCGAPEWMLGVIMTIASVIFGTLAKKEFHGEKVIQPIHF